MAAISKRQLQLAAIFTTLIPLYLLLDHWYTPTGFGVTNARDVAWYTKTALGVQVDDPFNISAVAALCAEQKSWRPNLYITIDDANGGIGNVRAAMIDFLYFAISAGTSIVASPISRRSDRDLGSLWNGMMPFDNFFDVDNLVSVLNRACPQMVVYKTQEEFKGFTCLTRFQPTSLRSDLQDEELEPQVFFKRFDDFLVQQNIVDYANKTLVPLGRTLWDSIDTTTQPHLRRAIGRLVQPRPDVRRLAETIIANLGVQYDMHIAPSSRIHKHAFMGAHLRTETDAHDAHRLDKPEDAFDGQTDSYLSQALASGLQVLYVASGNASDIERFASKACE
jgi:hypothetical protein